MTPEVEVTDVQGLRKLARAGRKAFAALPISRFVRVMRETMREYIVAREQGVSQEDAVKGIEAVLRAEWPQRPTKYPTCDECDNSGWRITACTHAMRCNRYRCGTSEPAWEHNYAVPCECVSGDKFRAKPPAVVDELATVGRTKRRRQGGFSRMGI